MVMVVAADDPGEGDGAGAGCGDGVDGVDVEPPQPAINPRTSATRTIRTQYIRSLQTEESACCGATRLPVHVPAIAVEKGRLSCGVRGNLACE
jgi:hypothetical protein